MAVISMTYIPLTVPNIPIYQIFYSEQTRRGLDPGFIPLDNVHNEVRPDGATLPPASPEHPGSSSW
jgi:hypothetical protein